MQGLGNFYTAVVIEYFASPLDATQIQVLQEKYKEIRIPILRPGRLSSMPAGSIMAKMIDNYELNDVMIFYPIFPHIHTPVKAGEQIIVIYGSVDRDDRIGYWISRKPADLVAEDVNYTHNDRSNFTSKLIGTRLSTPDVQPISNKFPDAGNAGVSYSSVVQKSDTYSQDFQGESVPRYFPKSPDLSIQGSNNTLIVLGSNTTLGKEKSPGSGMIDIVAGRGQTEDTQPTSTFTNVRNYEETNKSVEINPNEGSLDFINDLSRINISMNLNVDSDFNIDAGDSSGTAPAVVVKTDQIRLLARQDLKIVVGTGADPSSIIMKSNGDIIITPSSLGLIKLGGEDATGAILASVESIVTAGKVEAPSLVSTAGGILGAPALPATGIFATKVLVKVT